MSRSLLNDRRAFLQKTVSTASVAGAIGIYSSNCSAADKGGSDSAERLPREVIIATVAQEGLRSDSPKQMVNHMLVRMREVGQLTPDVICLPEIFPFSNINKRISVAEVAEEGIGPILEPFAKFAADHRCYVVCPVYTKQGGNCFNAAVFLDRKGKILGEYRKTYCTVGEIEAGVVPGPKNPPVFDVDFGKVGAQICFDIEWDAGWKHLRDVGAEIVFWPSAFAGGRMVNTKAWQNRYCVVSSTNKDVSKICDITGDELAATSRWHPWVCATINLEKVFIHTWPFVNRFGDIVAKHGSRIRITTHAFEEWTIIESRHPTLRIADVMAEFELVSIDDHLRAAEKKQNSTRPI